MQAPLPWACWGLGCYSFSQCFMCEVAEQAGRVTVTVSDELFELQPPPSSETDQTKGGSAHRIKPILVFFHHPLSISRISEFAIQLQHFVDECLIK